MLSIAFRKTAGENDLALGSGSLGNAERSDAQLREESIEARTFEMKTAKAHSESKGPGLGGVAPCANVHTCVAFDRIERDVREV